MKDRPVNVFIDHPPEEVKPFVERTARADFERLKQKLKGNTPPRRERSAIERRASDEDQNGG